MYNLCWSPYTVSMLTRFTIEVVRIQCSVFEKYTDEFNDGTDNSLFVSVLQAIKLHKIRFP